MASNDDDALSLAALQTQINEVKAKLAGYLERETTSSLANRVTAAEDMVLRMADLVADTQLGVYRTDKLATVNAVKAAARAIEQRRKDDAA